jgi:hypothetical protein
MMRSLAAVGVTACVLLAAPVAHAQKKFGDQGEFIISADRLVPFISYTHFSNNTPGPIGMGVAKDTNSVDQSSVSLLWGATTPQSFFSIPRVGFDYVLIPNVTLGGDLVVFFQPSSNASHEQDFTDGTSHIDNTNRPSETIFGFAPRGGYILGLSDLFALWLRGGFSYYTLSDKLTNGNVSVSSGRDQFALDLEPQFVFTPIPHLGFTAGATADIPVFGHNWDAAGNSAWSSQLFLGITIGMLGYF